jgi:hypothetical protein
MMLAAMTIGLVGCTPAPPERSTYEENFQEPTATPEFAPEAAAEQNLPYFQETLRLFSVGAEPVEGVPVVNALTAAGFDRSKMQVSFDRSKTDLQADNIFVSVLFGTECLIGQIVVADRSFVAEVAPAVGPEQNICLIGVTRPIDW